MPITLRAPTKREHDQLIKVTGGDNAKMHWFRIFSWANDTESEYGLNMPERALRGYASYHYWDWLHASRRYASLGFRPACDLASEAMETENEPIVMGTLYMGGEPVKVPKNPTRNGDITAYIPGAKLEMREPLPIPDYQVMGYRVGNAAIADRCLLNMISYEDIEKATEREEN